MSYYNDLDACFIIAEIGVNHNGDVNLAKRMIDQAKLSGADAVKFQTFSADRLVTPRTKKAPYHALNTASEETHYQMIKKLELRDSNHKLLKNYCDNVNIEFLSTPYDVESVDFLEKLGVSQYKVASADLTDLVLHKRIVLTKKPTIISVGMSTLGEIEETLSIYKNHGHNNIILLQCVSNYPCSSESLNLRVMNTLRSAFQVPVGFSDHSVDCEAAIVSVALGAKVIEKHFTLDKQLKGPDQKTSSTPDEFASLVYSIRKAEKILGSPYKYCQNEEKDNLMVSRKSVTLRKEIKKGKTIQEADLVMKRPGIGLPANNIPHIIGMEARRNLLKNYQLKWDDLK